VRKFEGLQTGGRFPLTFNVIALSSALRADGSPQIDLLRAAFESAFGLLHRDSIFRLSPSPPVDEVTPNPIKRMKSWLLSRPQSPSALRIHSPCAFTIDFDPARIQLVLVLERNPGPPYFFRKRVSTVPYFLVVSTRRRGTSLSSSSSLALVSPRGLSCELADLVTCPEGAQAFSNFTETLCCPARD